MSKAIRRLKLWWKRSRCPHHRTVHYFPEKPVRCVLSGGGCRSEGPHSGVVFEGCLNCHKVWVRDWQE